MTHEPPLSPQEDRLHQVESLHLQGWTHRQIAAHLHVSPKTVARDLKRVEAQRLDRLTRKVAAERLHSIAVFRHTQAVLWKAIDALMEKQDHKFIASPARAVVDAEKAVNATLDALAKEAGAGPRTVADLYRIFTQEEIDADLHAGASDDSAPHDDPLADDDGAAVA